MRRCFGVAPSSLAAWLLWPLSAALAVHLPAAAAEIVVAGDCELREAVFTANGVQHPDCAVGDPGVDTIVLTGDVSLASDLPAAGLIVVSEIVLEGNGHTISRALGAPEFRIFSVTSVGEDVGDLTLRDTTIRGGKSDQGGGIYNDGVTVLLTRSTVTDNVAGDGGGIYNNGGTVTLYDSEISDNEALNGGLMTRGGGIYNNGGVVSLTGVTLTGNHAAWDLDFSGGGLGGGIYTGSGGTVDIISSTVSQNSAGISSYFGGLAGGLLNRGSLVNITNSTFSQNITEGSYGGDIVAEGEVRTVLITNSTIFGSVSGRACLSTCCERVALQNTIATEVSSCGCLVGDDGGNFGCDTDVTHLSPTLADNGGPTLTHALLADSNAIDGAGDCASLDPALAADQRGAPRFDGTCDSGAFEYGGCPILELADDTVTGTALHEECDIHVGPNFGVAGPDGNLTLTAGVSVTVFDGFEVLTDASAIFGLDPSLQMSSALEAAKAAGWVPPQQ